MCKVSWSQVSTLIAARPNCKKATSSRKLISNQSRHLQITIKWLHRLIPVKLKSYRFVDTGCVHFSFCGRGDGRNSWDFSLPYFEHWGETVPVKENAKGGSVFRSGSPAAKCIYRTAVAIVATTRSVPVWRWI